MQQILIRMKISQKMISEIHNYGVYDRYKYMDVENTNASKSTRKCPTNRLKIAQFRTILNRWVYITKHHNVDSYLLDALT